ncbi:unnamed protein product [Rotaria sp. Silwood2]|nr:unnamed protein product [Rotaria sp. Silwood2]CAF2928561.1 unnamed protein product [Rotaria sp. Silwood2]CAF3328096.1 unnamed protein product [Rotaria sp. Silwood2]CAF4362504.1 unnamed protein product [Rotaria sp. Silwood2]CAF4392131.1 unnamed protein product [Rotaria sp. Silwood2]
MDVINMIKIDDLITDELYNKYYQIKLMYDSMKNKNVKISEQRKPYNSSKNIDNPKSTIHNHREIRWEIDYDAEGVLFYE